MRRVTPVLLAVAATAVAGLALAAPGDDVSTHQLVHDGARALKESNYPRAAQLFDQAAALDPGLAHAHLGLALAALGRGDRKAFDRAFRTVDALTKGAPEVRYLLAVERWRAGDLRVAEDELRGACRADTMFLEARTVLAAVRTVRGDLKGAAAALREALAIDASYAPARFQLGALLAARGDVDGALAELRAALSGDPDLDAGRPEDPLRFDDRRLLLGSAHGSGFGLPLPIPAPSFLPPARREEPLLPAEIPAVPEWYLSYQMGLFLEDGAHWAQAARLLERALSLNDRESARIPVADRLVDYLPHRHLARVCYETGDLQEARLHLDAARNQAAGGPESLRLLDTLLRMAAGAVRIVLAPVPDRTARETVTIRGLVTARDAPPFVDVAGQKAYPRPASPDEIRAVLAGRPAPGGPGAASPLYFEVAACPLPLPGPNVVRVRAGSGSEIEVLVVRDTPAPSAMKAGGGR